MSDVPWKARMKTSCSHVRCSMKGRSDTGTVSHAMSGVLWKVSVMYHEDSLSTCWVFHERKAWQRMKSVCQCWVFQEKVSACHCVRCAMEGRCVDWVGHRPGQYTKIQVSTAAMSANAKYVKRFKAQSWCKTDCFYLLHHDFDQFSGECPMNIVNIGILLHSARMLGLKQNVCCITGCMSGLLSAIVIFMIWQTPWFWSPWSWSTAPAVLANTAVVVVHRCYIALFFTLKQTHLYVQHIYETVTKGGDTVHYKY